MDSRKEIIRRLEATRVVAIIRGMSPAVCVKLAEAYQVGGIRLVEIAFNQVGSVGDTVTAIRAVKAVVPGMCVGAGTVVTEEQLDLAIAAGAEFVVMPNCNPTVIRNAKSAGLLTLPGAFTPTEMVTAHEAGADYVKVFPARALGPQYVKDVLAPLKYLKLIAVGGISSGNASDYIRAGCVGVAVGGSLVNEEWIAAGEYGKIAGVARELVESCK